ncbi:MAG: LysR family transcriptional regulator, partial [Myxococcota bacterium]
MNERVDGLEVFVEVASTGSFTSAASQLGVTRSAVSKTIARLERRLGVRLVQRTTRRQSLTEEGRTYYETCMRVLAELEAVEASLDARRGVVRGTLRVTVPMVFGRHCVAPALVELAAQHPSLAIDLSFSDRVVDLVDDGFDLAVRIGPVPDSASLSMRKVGVQEMVIGASPSYLDVHGRPESIADLEAHTLLAYTKLQDPWRVGGRTLAVHSRLRFDDLDALADAALQGGGLALLPRWMMLAATQTGAYEFVLAELPAQRLPIS